MVYFGDLVLARTWAEKLLCVLQGMECEELPDGDYSRFVYLFCAIQHSHACYRRAGMTNIALQIMHALKLDYHRAEKTVTHHRPAFAMSGYDFDTSFSFMSPTSCGCFIPAAKRGHWLLAPEDIDIDEFRQWLPAPEYGTGEGPSCSYGKYCEIECSLHYYMGGTQSGVAPAEVYERLDPPQYETAIFVAKWHIEKLWRSPYVIVEGQMVIGRSCAKLGRTADAEVAFVEAIAAARRYAFLFLEFLAIRDFIVYVLDGAGRRDEHFAALGGVIERMVLPASEYMEALDCAGLDAQAAVAAYKAGAA